VRECRKVIGENNEFLRRWLGHADARQVFDLPDTHAFNLCGL
jgi:hypothetical protein